MLSDSEASLVPEAEILRSACGLAQDDNPYWEVVLDKPEGTIGRHYSSQLYGESDAARGS